MATLNYRRVLCRVHVTTLAMAVGVVMLLLVVAGCFQGLVPDGDTGDNGDTTPVPNSNVNGVFIGSERCSLCHINQHSNWTATLHAEALTTLEEIGQDTNPNCLPCHVVGYGEDGGFVDAVTTEVLAGVGCESCHGAARDHVENVADKSKRPTVDLTSELCGKCHTGSHHPHIDEWQTSGHSLVTEGPADDFTAGVLLSACGSCHSGEYYYTVDLMGGSMDGDALVGTTREEQLAIECAMCHDPHMQTGNAVEPADGRDYQLRFPEVATPTPTNDADAPTDKDRFNLCGQCHHSRGRDWTSESRGPHHSVQSNVYVGEMPTPTGTSPLVLSRTSVHSFTREQCATCHLYRQDFQSEVAPAIAGHTFEVDNLSCAETGCHPSSAQAIAAQTTLQSEVQTRLDAIKTALGDESTWEYSATGGPSDQSSITDAVKQARFLYHYMLSDGSLGIHNPDYVRSMLDKAESLLGI